MADTITISRKDPNLKSMQYDFLRKEGLKHIQRYAGKTWTDFNSHDPGITMLEVFCYVMTDLGYRIDYDIKDILTANPNDDSGIDLKNFFTACEILPNCPVTFNDYRKLLIDVEVEDTEVTGCKFAGVKNAWIEKSEDQEQDFYIDKENSELTYDVVETGQAPIDVKVLYDVLLEFGKCDEFGDLNENTLSELLVIEEHPLDTSMEGVEIKVKIEFPRWDEEGLDFTDAVSIKKTLNKQDITISFFELPSGYSIEFEELDVNNNVELSSKRPASPGLKPIKGIDEIEIKVDDFITELITTYQDKVEKVFEILAEVKATVHANRNLCEDFFRYRALKIEEILVCADIELALDADVNQVQAEIYHEIAKFLSPTVFFYRLDEMYDKCKDIQTFLYQSLDESKKTFTVEGDVTKKLVKEDILKVKYTEDEEFEFTVVSATLNKDDETITDVVVVEIITSELPSQGKFLFETIDDEAECLTTDQIFEGPKLKHGFIDDAELDAADRKKVLHVSDFIQIIMDVDGVVAVNEIQIANLPQDNDEGIESKSVKWCLDLAFEHNYVPRLSLDRSKLTFLKDDLPFEADQSEAELLIDILEKEEREQKLHDPELDIEVPVGEYKDIEDYTSLQEEFPVTYGVGTDGIISSATDLRKAQAKQMKGYLMFFDQLFANFLSQLAHVRHLFALNGDKDHLGELLIQRSYFTQPLINIAPHSTDLYTDIAGHEADLNLIAEDLELFELRKNKILNHLLGRFAENFTEYIMLSERIAGGSKTQKELIDDKLAFLNAYPEISGGRFKGINYKDPCKIWHVDNTAGLKKRASLLTGMAEKTLTSLQFRNKFQIVGTGTGGEGPFVLEVFENTMSVLLDSPSGVEYDTYDLAKEAIELMIINGVCREKYQIEEGTGGTFTFVLVCDDEVLAQSATAYNTLQEAEDSIESAVAIMEHELHYNHESNRKNLSAPIHNYFEVYITTDMAADPPTYTIAFTLHAEPFDTSPGSETLLTGEFTGEGKTGDTEAEVVEKGEAKMDELLWEVIRSGTETKRYLFECASESETEYKFYLTNRFCQALATSVESDFNKGLAEEIEENQDGTVIVSNSTENDGTYTVISATADDANIIIDVDPDQTGMELGSIVDGSLSFTEPFVFSIDKANKTFTVPGEDLTEKLSADDIISISDTISNNGDYTVVSVTLNGGDSDIIVAEVIPSNDIGTGDTLSYTKTFPIVGINNGTGENSIVVKGGGGDKAVKEMVAFFTEKFYSNEGMHIIEHTLLRPRINELLFVPADQNTLSESTNGTGSDGGMLSFTKRLDIVAANSTNKTFDVLSDITNELFHTGAFCTVSDTEANDGQYSVVGCTHDLGADITTIEVMEAVPTDIMATGSEGRLSYLHSVEITDIASATKHITVDSGQNTMADVISLEDPLSVTGSEGGANDGEFMARDVVDETGNVAVVEVDKIKQLVQDDLMPIVYDPDCDACKLEDPYSCIVSVILPYWPGRFTIKEFRKFVERTIRMEAPAHLVLRICWVSNAHMLEFEGSYKRWLLESSKTTIDKVQLSAALNELIETMSSLRTIHATATLHDCEAGDQIQNSIILTKSTIGNA